MTARAVQRHRMQIERRNFGLDISPLPVERLAGDHAGDVRRTEGRLEIEGKAADRRALECDRQSRLPLRRGPIVDAFLELRGNSEPIDRVAADEDDQDRDGGENLGPMGHRLSRNQAAAGFGALVVIGIRSLLRRRSTQFSTRVRP